MKLKEAVDEFIDLGADDKYLLRVRKQNYARKEDI